MIDLKKISIEGQYFDILCSLNLLENDNRSVVIFGKNGSGKTTISNAFLNYKLDGTDFSTVKFYDDKNNEVSIIKDNLWVFNETFIDNNVKLSEDKDGINAIVLFGENSEIDAKLDALNEKVKKEKENIINRNYQQYIDVKSPNYYEKHRKILKNIISSTWATREQEIKGTSKKASVNDVLIDEFISMKSPEKSLTELKARYKELLDKIKNSNPTCTTQNTIPYIKYEFKENEFLSIINTTIENKNESKFVTEILEEIKKMGFIQSLFDHVVDENTKICPVCYQKISQEHKHDIKDAISIIYNAEIQLYKDKLLNYKMPLDLFRGELILNENLHVDNLLLEYSNELKKLLNIAEIINNEIDEKIKNVYSTNEYTIHNFTIQLNKVNGVIDSINKKINEYNKDIIEYKNNFNELLMCNKEITYFDIIEQRKNLNKLKEEMVKAENDDKASNKFIEECENKIKELNNQKSNTGIALEEINKLLAYVFSSQKRLVLKPSSDPQKYNIYSKGRKIKLNKLSVGERNIISLCYFFEKMKSECRVNDYFKNEMLLVIDDPVSSFDYENKLGIISFLKRMCKEINDGNQNSKIIFLSHEFEICVGLQKILSDLKIKCQTKELKDRQLINLNSTKFSNYGNLLVNVYEYASEQRDDTEFLYGNLIRKTVEAYSNFNYKMAAHDFVVSPEILNKIKNEKLKTYFDSRMNKLVFNAESHTQDISHQLPDAFDLQQYSSSDQIQTAKDVLVFLDEIDHTHIAHYLQSITGALGNIEKWKNSIIANC